MPSARSLPLHHHENSNSNSSWVRFGRREEKERWAAAKHPTPWHFGWCDYADPPSTSTIPSALTPPISSPAKTSSTIRWPLPTFPVSSTITPSNPTTLISPTAPDSSSMIPPTPWASLASSSSLSRSGLSLSQSVLSTCMLCVIFVFDYDVICFAERFI